VLLHSSCQEISRNFDTLSVARPAEAPSLGTEGGLDKLNVTLNASSNKGNKSLSFTGVKRLEDFAEWAAAQSGKTIVLGGHSLWFRSFFQLYLPKAAEGELAAISKANKIQNCGAVGFTLQVGSAADGSPRYKIEPDSLRVIYLGFEAKKKKKS